MKRKLAGILAASLLAATLAGCSDVNVTQPDVKVSHEGSRSYIYFRNGYKPGEVEITQNEDGSYDVCVHGIPPTDFYSK